MPARQAGNAFGQLKSRDGCVAPLGATQHHSLRRNGNRATAIDDMRGHGARQRARRAALRDRRRHRPAAAWPLRESGREPLRLVASTGRRQRLAARALAPSASACRLPACAAVKLSSMPGRSSKTRAPPGCIHRRPHTAAAAPRPVPAHQGAAASCIWSRDRHELQMATVDVEIELRLAIALRAALQDRSRPARSSSSWRWSCSGSKRVCCTSVCAARRSQYSNRSARPTGTRAVRRNSTDVTDAAQPGSGPASADAGRAPCSDRAIAAQATLIAALSTKPCTSHLCGAQRPQQFAQFRAAAAGRHAGPQRHRGRNGAVARAKCPATPESTGSRPVVRTRRRDAADPISSPSLATLSSRSLKSTPSIQMSTGKLTLLSADTFSPRSGGASESSVAGCLWRLRPEFQRQPVALFPAALPCRCLLGRCGNQQAVTSNAALSMPEWSMPDWP